MIRIEKKVLKAVCDACGKPLPTDLGDIHQAHFGRLENHFGWGSDLDAIASDNTGLDLCSECYLKALGALGLKP